MAAVLPPGAAKPASQALSSDLAHIGRFVDRDAAQLAILARAGALTAAHVPSTIDETARDLVRTREDTRRDLRADFVHRAHVVLVCRGV